MSRLSDYSKFDHLEDSDEEEGPSLPQQAAVPLGGDATTAGEADVALATSRKDPTTGRYVFEYGGNKVYEWEQSLEGKVNTDERSQLHQPQA